MSSVKPNERGVASGVHAMLMDTARILAVGIAFPLVLSQVPELVLFHVFLFGGGLSGTPQVLAAFEFGMHEAFLVAAIISIIAAVISFLRPAGAPTEALPSTGTGQPHEQLP